MEWAVFIDHNNFYYKFWTTSKIKIKKDQKLYFYGFRLNNEAFTQ